MIPSLPRLHQTYAQLRAVRHALQTFESGGSDVTANLTAAYMHILDAEIAMKIAIRNMTLKSTDVVDN